jgi:hypothetical protein
MLMLSNEKIKGPAKTLDPRPHNLNLRKRVEVKVDLSPMVDLNEDPDDYPNTDVSVENPVIDLQAFPFSSPKKKIVTYDSDEDSLPEGGIHLPEVPLFIESENEETRGAVEPCNEMAIKMIGRSFGGVKNGRRTGVTLSSPLTYELPNPPYYSGYSPKFKHHYDTRSQGLRNGIEDDFSVSNVPYNKSRIASPVPNNLETKEPIVLDQNDNLSLSSLSSNEADDRANEEIPGDALDERVPPSHDFSPPLQGHRPITRSMKKISDEEYQELLKTKL